MEPYRDTIHNFVHFSLFNVSCGVLDVVVYGEEFNSTPSVSSLYSLDVPNSTQKWTWAWPLIPCVLIEMWCGRVTLWPRVIVINASTAAGINFIKYEGHWHTSKGHFVVLNWPLVVELWNNVLNWSIFNPFSIHINHLLLFIRNRAQTLKLPTCLSNISQFSENSLQNWNPPNRNIEVLKKNQGNGDQKCY